MIFKSFISNIKFNNEILYWPLCNAFLKWKFVKSPFNIDLILNKKLTPSVVVKKWKNVYQVNHFLDRFIIYGKIELKDDKWAPRKLTYVPFRCSWQSMKRAIFSIFIYCQRGNIINTKKKYFNRIFRILFIISVKWIIYMILCQLTQKIETTYAHL